MHLAVSCFAVMHKLLAANFCQSSEDFAFEPAVIDLLWQISPVHLLLHLLVEPHRLLATAAELGDLVLGDGGGGQAGRGSTGKSNLVKVRFRVAPEPAGPN